MLLLHLTIALLSIITTTFAVFSPSKLKLRISTALAAGTLATGTILVISTRSALLSACLSGIFYLVIVSSGLLVANRRLAFQKSEL